MSTQQNFQAISGNWETVSNWSGGFIPTSTDDVAIGDFGDSSAILTNNVTVNSIAVNVGSVLNIDDGSLVATDGSVTSPGDTDVVVTGNHGTINVADGANLQLLGNDYLNDGTVNEAALGNLTFGNFNADFTLSGSGTINAIDDINMNGDLTLSGKGSINLGGPTGQAFISGGDAFTNVDDTISGLGQISVVSFDNQAGGTVNAGSASDVGTGDFMLIEVGSNANVGAISNEGVVNVVALAALIVEANNVDGGSLVNSGQINVAAAAGLQIADAFTLSGAGDVNLNGASAFVGGEGGTRQTLTNESSIFGEASQTFVGENGAGGDLLNLVNSGSIVAFASGNELTIATGANVIEDAGGLLEADSFAHLVIDSAVATGALADGLAGGTIESNFGGVVTIASSVGAGAGSPLGAATGQVVIDTGTVEFLAGSSDTIPIAFDGAGGALEVHSAKTVLGAISGFVSGDALLLTGDALKSVAIGTGSLDVVTNDGAFDFAHVAFNGPVTGYVGFASVSSAGLEDVLFTDGNVVPLFGTDATFFQSAADTSVDGAGDTIDFQGGAVNTTLLAGTGDEADKVNGSGGVITLREAQAKVVGGSDTIELFSGTTGNVVSLFATAGHFDTVTGADMSIFLDGAQTSVTGAGDTIHFETGFTGNQVSLRAAAGLRDTVAGSDGVVDLHGTSANVIGGGDTIDLISGAGDVASLRDTGSAADLVQGVAGTFDLNGATAKATSGGDTFAFAGSDTLGLVGTAETMAFGHGIGGLDSITGVGSSDFFQFSKADFADFAALQAHTTQSGANTVISLSASDAVTLVGVKASTLEAAQFKFV